MDSDVLSRSVIDIRPPPILITSSIVQLMSPHPHRLSSRGSSSTMSMSSGALAHPASSQESEMHPTICIEMTALAQQEHMSADNANGDQIDDDDDYAVDSHIVELSEIIDREMRSNTWKSSSSQAQTIFRVPKPNNEAADKMMSTYKPLFLSIGPYHVNATEEMRRKEQGKLYVLDKFIPQGGRPSVLEYTQAVKSMEAKARSCYEGDVGMDSNAFCRMLLLDAVQLILLLLKLLGGGFTEDDDTPAASGAGTVEAEAQAASPSPSQGCTIRTRDMIMTVHDLMMLENQIPFFVVDKIYELLNGNAVKMTPLRRLAWEAMRNLVGGVIPSAAPNDDDLHLLEFQHLVHVCHVYLKPSKEILNDNKTGKYGKFRRATEYYEAGVTFRRWCSDAAGSQRRRPMLDVAFNNGVLSVALQDINETTGYILRNILSYEQKYNRTATSPETSYVTAYVMFMSQLLVSAEDVALLSSRGVVEHLLGDDGEVCALFRGLADGLAFDAGSDHYLSPVQMALQAHCRHRRYRWGAWIVRHRFGNPWLVAAWLVGGSAVLCTIIQTVFTVLSYVQQPH